MFVNVFREIDQVTLSEDVLVVLVVFVAVVAQRKAVGAKSMSLQVPEIV